jgi:hypothetical protein
MARDSFAGGFALCCALATATLLLLAAIATDVYVRTAVEESRIDGHRSTSSKGWQRVEKPPHALKIRPKGL